MKHRIGNAHNAGVGNFNLVTEKKLVKEESFFNQLEEAIKNLGAKNSKQALKKAKDYLAAGKSVTIDGKYFIIEKR